MLRVNPSTSLKSATRSRRFDERPFDKHTLEVALDVFDVVFLGVKELMEQLTGSAFDLLITPYGSAFPKEAWNAILKYRKAGGNWVNLGGVPLSVPIRKEETEWKKEVHQTAYHKKLGITQAFPVTDLNVMIRPRAGDFCYSDLELEVIRRDIQIARVKDIHVRCAVCANGGAARKVGSLFEIPLSVVDPAAVRNFLEIIKQPA